MKSCPNCNLYFNDGYACPQCGGALYDQDAYMQQQPAYPQETMAYGSYPAAPGYEQPYAQQQAYGYAPAQQPQQPYAQQPAAYQPTQAYVAPEPAYTAPEPAYAEPAYLEPVPEPAASTASAPLVIEQKGSRGKTVTIVILAVLAVALGAACTFFALNGSSEPKPTELETAVVNSAWTWQTNVNDMLDEMDAAAAMLRGSSDNADATASAAAAEGGEAGATAEAEATAPAEEGEVAPTEAPNATETPDAPDAAAASEEPIAEDASAATEELTPDEAAAIAETKDAVTAIAEGDMSGAAAAENALGSEFAQMGESVGELLGYTVALASLASEEQMQALDAPMQALREDYPDLVSAWDAVRDTITTYMANSFSDQAGATGTSDSATANEAITDAGTENADATAEDAANDAADAQNAENAADENALATSDAATWEAFLEDFRAATATFMQMAADAGFSLS